MSNDVGLGAFWVLGLLGLLAVLSGGGGDDAEDGGAQPVLGAEATLARALQSPPAGAAADRAVEHVTPQLLAELDRRRAAITQTLDEAERYLRD